MHDTGFKSDTVKDVKVMLYGRGDKRNGKIKVASPRIICQNDFRPSKSYLREVFVTGKRVNG